jgi:hypothetical protein
VVVCTGRTERRHDGIEIWPLATFLRRLDEGAI